MASAHIYSNQADSLLSSYFDGSHPVPTFSKSKVKKSLGQADIVSFNIS